jgi:CheY-like chemotaxis protein
MAQILIVEDDPHSARVLRCLLRSSGYDEVITSLDADDILRRCESGAVDLALLDVSLTDCKLSGKPIDGVGLCQRIKQSTGDRPVPVILVTANAMRGDAERLLHESGADDYVSKPIQDHDGLLQLVAAHLARERVSDCEVIQHRGAGFQPAGR